MGRDSAELTEGFSCNASSSTHLRGELIGCGGKADEMKIGAASGSKVRCTLFRRGQAGGTNRSASL